MVCKYWCFPAALFSVFIFSSATYAEENYVITEKDKKFFPKELVIPAGQKVKITIKNLDSTPAEFESTALNREKIVGGNSEIIIFIGPMDAGIYSYTDDFHQTSTATIIAK